MNIQDSRVFSYPSDDMILKANLLQYSDKVLKYKHFGFDIWILKCKS